MFRETTTTRNKRVCVGQQWTMKQNLNTLFVNWVSIIKLCTCFSALVNSNFLDTTATRRAVQPAPCKKWKKKQENTIKTKLLCNYNCWVMGKTVKNNCFQASRWELPVTVKGGNIIVLLYINVCLVCMYVVSSLKCWFSSSVLFVYCSSIHNKKKNQMVFPILP